MKMVASPLLHFSSFFFNDTATTEIYTLSLHDALPIYLYVQLRVRPDRRFERDGHDILSRSEEHTSELQSRQYLACRLLLEKKTKKITPERVRTEPMRERRCRRSTRVT